MALTADYNLALERQAELAQRLAKREDRLFKIVDQMGNGDPAIWQRWLDAYPSLLPGLNAEDGAEVGRSFGMFRPALDSALHALQFGDTFACTPQIANWLETAARSIPETYALEPGAAPSEEGFFWVGGPCSPQPPCVHAYSWRTREDGIDGAAFGHLSSRKDKVLTLTFVHPWTYNSTLGEGLHGTSSDGLDPFTPMANSATAGLGERIARFWAATFVFLQQRVFATTRYVAERHTRKRLERLGATQEPTVRVVHLRRQIGDAHAEEYGDTVHEWHWQWLVRGHWRNQYFPSQQRNRPIFVQPYVKGPQDKPLKPVTTTVYSVDR